MTDKQDTTLQYPLPVKLRYSGAQENENEKESEKKNENGKE